MTAQQHSPTQLVRTSSCIIKCILTTFDGNVMIPQYRINNYLIDLYFPEHLLAIECDENHHENKTNIICDKIRENELIHTLGCRFIRFSPNKKDFNLFKLLNDIFVHLSVFPRQKLNWCCIMKYNNNIIIRINNNISWPMALNLTIILILLFFILII